MQEGITSNFGKTRLKKYNLQTKLQGWTVNKSGKGV